MNYFDLHCDTPYQCYMKKLSFSDASLAVSRSCGAFFDSWYQSFAVWIRDDAPEPFCLYREIIKDFKVKLSEKPDNLTPVFTVEGGALLEDDPSRLDILKADGIRALTLTWNGENRIAGGAGSDKGLTRFGEAVIEKMNALGIAADLSHLNEKSFFAAAELAEKPLATHSCCRAVFDHRRNLTDEQLRLIAAKGGITGLCFYPAFLGGDVFEQLYENIFHILDMGLEDTAAIGSDFDGADMDLRLKTPADIRYLYDYLLSRGLTERILGKIFYSNAAKYYGVFDKTQNV